MKLPGVLPGRWLRSAASSLDRAAVRAAMWSTHRSSPRVRDLPHDERMARLAEIAAVYGAPRYIDAPETFFPPALAASPELTPVRPYGRSGRVVDLAWPSPHEPLLPPLAETYGAHRANRTAHARLFHHARARPAVVAIHGYLGGNYAFEERSFPVRWMYRKGFDVALAVLPFHGLRARQDRPRAPLFPGSDPRFTIEGCRQAVGDVRALVRHLRDRGAPAVGLMGMSLGGYLTALLATLEDELAFAVPIIPLASFADIAREQGRFGEGALAGRQHEAYDDVLRVVSPFARPSRARGRMLVLAAEADRITPKRHAERLAEHFDAPLLVFPGGHLLQFGRDEAFARLGRLWDELGVLSHQRLA